MPFPSNSGRIGPLKSDELRTSLPAWALVGPQKSYPFLGLGVVAVLLVVAGHRCLLVVFSAVQRGHYNFHLQKVQLTGVATFACKKGNGGNAG